MLMFALAGSLLAFQFLRCAALKSCVASPYVHPRQPLGYRDPSQSLQWGRNEQPVLALWERGCWSAKLYRMVISFAPVLILQIEAADAYFL